MSITTGSVLHILGIPTIVNREEFIETVPGAYVLNSSIGLIMLVERMPEDRNRFICSLDENGATKVLDAFQLAIILQDYKAEKIAELREVETPLKQLILNYLSENGGATKSTLGRTFKVCYDTISDALYDLSGKYIRESDEGIYTLIPGKDVYELTALEDPKSYDFNGNFWGKDEN